MTVTLCNIARLKYDTVGRSPKLRGLTAIQRTTVGWEAPVPVDGYQSRKLEHEKTGGINEFNQGREHRQLLGNRQRC